MGDEKDGEFSSPNYNIKTPKHYIKFERLNKVCRVCLYEEETTDIFDLHYDGHYISDLIYFCCSVQVIKNDNYPQNICAKCIYELINVFEFIQKCCNSSEYLRTLVDGNNENIKENIEESFDQDELKSDGDDNRLKETSSPVATEMDEDIDDCVAKVESESDDESDAHESNSERQEQEIKNEETSQKLAVKRPPYACKDCDLRWDSFKELKSHRKLANHSKSTNSYCSVCSKGFTTKDVLRQHMRTHTKEKPFQCELCFASFSISRNLKRHVMTHTGERPFICDTCGKGFIQQVTLIEHKRIHTGEKPFICNYCGKAMKRATELKGHIARHVLEEQEDSRKLDENDDHIECNICKKLANSKRALRIHKSVAHGKKSQLCNICGKGFVGKQGLVSHLKTHSGEKPFPCPHCQKRFAHRTSLKDHILIHTGEKPHVCKTCDKGFIQHHHLVHHMRTHSGEKPYVCRFCGKAFALKGNLTVHTRLHTGETPFVCSVCDCGFYDSSTLKKHMRFHATCEPTSD